MITFDVIGIPMPQGSMKAFNANGRAMMKPSGGNKFAAWRNAVSEAARTAKGHTPAITGPVVLTVAFRFPMPKSRPARTRQLGVACKTTAPDLDKLVRCICDALVAAAVITDDAIIFRLEATKTETTSWTGATVSIGPF